MRYPRRRPSRSAILTSLLCISLLSASAVSLAAQADSQSAPPPSRPARIVTLLETRATNSATQPAPEATSEPGLKANIPANFHSFATVHAPAQDGKPAAAREPVSDELTLRFSAPTAILHLKTTPDFELLKPGERGGTCAEGNHYAAGDTCTVRIAFTPKGPGNRTGKLTVTHSAAAHPESIGLGGTNYAPAVSFVPSIITTIPSTYNATAKKGLMTAPWYLSFDGGDNLYIADLGGNNQSPPPEIDLIDSSGSLTLFAGSSTSNLGDGSDATGAELISPQGMGTDPFGGLYIADYEEGRVRYVDIDQYISTVAGPGSSCTALPCAASQYSLRGVTSAIVSPQNDVYLSLFGNNQELQLASGDLYLYGSDPEGFDGPLSLALDTNNDLFYSSFYYCQVRSVNPSNRQTAIVAGTQQCGFSGDGGQARSAEVNSPREIAVDAANNLYIADEGNHVIRRIDANTGLIHTIAGMAGKLGFTGNGGPATSAMLDDGYGVAVDSNGSVYVAEYPTGDVRKIGPTGNLVFAAVTGTVTPVQTITLSNTGNSQLSISQVYWSGVNTIDFTTDPHTTTCPFLASGIGTVYVGQTCTIGIIFKPTVVGAESTTLNFVDNTGLGLNTIQLNGTGQKRTPTLTWPKPANITTTTALSSTQLDATAAFGGAALPGTFVYNPAAGTTLTAGTHTLAVTFTPTNTALYNIVGTSTTITVTAAAVKPAVTLATNRNPGRVMLPITFAVALEKKNGVEPTGTVKFFNGKVLLGSAQLSGARASLTVRTLTQGVHAITAVYQGDKHFTAAASPAIQQKIAR